MEGFIRYAWLMRLLRRPSRRTPRNDSEYTFASGVDFLGWVHFPDHRVLRGATKRRMVRRIKERPESETLQSYLGLLKHGNTFKVRQEVLQNYWLEQTTPASGAGLNADT